MKKNLLLISLQLCFSIALAQTFTKDHFVYKVTSTSPAEVEIKTGSGITKHAVIPSTVEDSVGTLYNVTSIGTGAFAYLQLLSVEIPNSILNIEDFAFIDNDLTSIVIPSSVTSVGLATFQNNNLTSVTVESFTPITEIDNGAFSDTQFTDATLYVPSGAESAYKEATPWKKFVNISTILSVNNVELTNEVTIFPNPTKEFVSVSVEGIDEADVKVLSITGLVVQEESLSNGIAQFKLNGKAGLYLIEVISGNQVAVFKVIKD